MFLHFHQMLWKKCLDITKCCERMFPVCFPCSSTSLDCFHIIGGVFWIFVHCLASVMRELLKTAGVVWEWANQKAPCFVHNQSNTNTNTTTYTNTHTDTIITIISSLQIQSPFLSIRQTAQKTQLDWTFENQNCINFPLSASKSRNIISNYDFPVNFMPHLKPSPNVV